MPRTTEKDKLLAGLDECLKQADELHLALVGIHISYAIEILRANLVVEDEPRGKVN
jgi:hypothetical protein